MDRTFIDDNQTSRIGCPRRQVLRLPLRLQEPVDPDSAYGNPTIASCYGKKIKNPLLERCLSDGHFVLRKPGDLVLLRLWP